MSKDTLKIISLIVGGIGVVAGGIVLASKVIEKHNREKYIICGDTLEDILPIGD